MGLQLLGTAFTSLQRWWILPKFIPTGTRASDSTRMLLPHWGYQGIAGPGVIFLANSEWVGKHLCFSEERTACLFVHGPCSQDRFPLGTKGKEKLGGFPSILEEYACFLEIGATLGEQLLLSARGKLPKFFDFIPINTYFPCFLPLRQVSDCDPASITP